MKRVEVLIPTCNRKTSLAITLASLANQTYTDFDVIISDQSDGDGYLDAPELQAIYRIMDAHGQRVTALRHLPRRGMAEQRHFLLGQSQAPYVLFADDDVFFERETLARVVQVIERERCAFVGCYPVGLSFRDDVRPHEQTVELWDGPVEPEIVEPGSPAWHRYKLHNAANLYHVAQRLRPGETRLYKVAWVGAACLYDREKLLSVGGFGYWHRLPPEHAGEEVLVQLLLQRRYGGCAIIPSGAYHLELPTTIPDRRANAVSLLPELLQALGLDAQAAEGAEAASSQSPPSAPGAASSD